MFNKNPNARTEPRKPRREMIGTMVSVAVLLVTGEIRAEQTIPAALTGKSIVLSWSDMRTLKNQPSGKIITIGQDSAASVYVSTARRVFSSLKRTSYGSGHGPKEKTNNEISGAEHLLHWHFEDGSLVADQVFLRGARRVSIIFADDFRNCSVRVLHGKETGGEPIVFMGMNGDGPWEVLDIKVTSTSCAVREGNILADHQ